MVRSKHGMNYPPFKDSTMQVSRQEFVRNKAQEQRTKDLSEIQDAINKLNRSLTAINEQIALNEGELIRLDKETELAFEDLQSAQRLNQINPQATTFQDVQAYNQRMNDLAVEKQVYNALMNGDANSVGLRTMAKETRRGIAALENQKRRVQGMLGMDVKGADNIVRSAEIGALSTGALAVLFLERARLFSQQFTSVTPSRPQAVVEGETLSTSSDDSDSVFPRTDDGAYLFAAECPLSAKCPVRIVRGPTCPSHVER